jgi:4-amino-4-deoxy-L-arabinose transferase-like glycosyltransferase
LQPSSLAKRGSLLLFLVIIAAYLYGLGHLPLVGPDEPRYAQIAREMLLRNDLITPTLGGHLWFEKPALLYWMMMGSFKLFGVSEWSTRFPSALSGILTIAAVFLVARKAERVEGDEPRRDWSFWSALVSATTLGMIVFSRAASFDIVLTMTLTWALACFILSELELNTRGRGLLLAGFYVFIGLSLLAKGFIGIVLPLGIVGGYFVLRRTWPDRRTFFSLVWGIPLALLVAATWYAPVIWRHGWPFIDEFILQHQLARYVSNNYRHPGPFFYYLPIIVLLSLPWTVFLVDGVAKALGSRPLADSGDARRKVFTFALVWLVLPLVFFSFARAKLPAYILPVLPAAALIVSERIARLTSDSKAARWPLRLSGLVCIVSAIGVLIYSRRSTDVALYCGILIAATLIVVGALALLSRYRQASLLSIGASSLVIAALALFCGATKLAERESAKRLLQLADAKGYSQTPIYGLQPDDRTPEFYAAGRVIYAPDGEPVMYIGPPQLVNEALRRGEVLLAFVPIEGVEQQTSAWAATTDVIGDNGRFALVAVKPR